jgi:hypothetical protein
LRFALAFLVVIPQESASRTFPAQSVKEPPLQIPADPIQAQPRDSSAPSTSAKTPAELEEAKLIRRLQMMMNMVMNVIAQDSTLSIDEAAQMIADARIAALAMFPGKELAYDLIWRPRFQRLMRERFRLM